MSQMNEDLTLGRLAGRILLAILLFAAAVWAADWLVWQGRMFAGKGYGSVNVDRFVVAPLKNHKEEYYPDGSVQTRCTRSLLPEGVPQAGGKPCWWVERHPVDFDR
jgi:hypothetical protein